MRYIVRRVDVTDWNASRWAGARFTHGCATGDDDEGSPSRAASEDYPRSGDAVCALNAQRYITRSRIAREGNAELVLHYGNVRPVDWAVCIRIRAKRVLDQVHQAVFVG